MQGKCFTCYTISPAPDLQLSFLRLVLCLHFPKLGSFPLGSEIRNLKVSLSKTPLPISLNDLSHFKMQILGRPIPCRVETLGLILSTTHGRERP